MSGVAVSLCVISCFQLTLQHCGSALLEPNRRLGCPLPAPQHAPCHVYHCQVHTASSRLTWGVFSPFLLLTTACHPPPIRLCTPTCYFWRFCPRCEHPKCKIRSLLYLHFFYLFEGVVKLQVYSGNLWEIRRGDFGYLICFHCLVSWLQWEWKQRRLLLQSAFSYSRAKSEALLCIQLEGYI